MIDVEREYSEAARNLSCFYIYYEEDTGAKDQVSYYDKVSLDRFNGIIIGYSQLKGRLVRGTDESELECVNEEKEEDEDYGNEDEDEDEDEDEEGD
ncbi:MAG: hypothetical protein EZS28_021400 [Streblomastix strix]|uniref:Uncharacterized protein n=1 Tax=Streblomastix strix TaxID=222440 RepID=A0A5J4VLH5_9EUKA|nr:MAG: hypothetical protein EZS28_021400 [Streblomastix strix]